MRRMFLVLGVVLAACGQQAAEPRGMAQQGAGLGAQATAPAEMAQQGAGLGAQTTAAWLRTSQQAAAQQVTRLEGRLLAFQIRPAALPAPGILSPTAGLSPTVGLASGGGAACGAPPAGVVGYEAAAEHVGEVATVQGQVVSVGRSGKARFLNFHDPYAGHFAVVIFASSWRAFPGELEDLYGGRCVRVAGAIKLYKGAPEIIVSDPGQILVLP